MSCSPARVILMGLSCIYYVTELIIVFITHMIFIVVCDYNEYFMRVAALALITTDDISLQTESSMA